MVAVGPGGGSGRARAVAQGSSWKDLQRSKIHQHAESLSDPVAGDRTWHNGLMLRFHDKVSISRPSLRLHLWVGVLVLLSRSHVA